MISQTIEYALRAMTHLAALEAGVSVNSETIAARTKVPPGYLSKVLRDLVVSGLVHSQRGPNGGFALVARADQISMLDIINAVDPIQRIKRCPLGNPLHVELCPLHHRLDNALAMIEKEFGRTTLAEILASNNESGSKSSRHCQSLVSHKPFLPKLVLPTVRGRKT